MSNPYVESEKKKAEALYQQRMSSPTARRARIAYNTALIFVLLLICAACILLIR